MGAVVLAGQGHLACVGDGVCVFGVCWWWHVCVWRVFVGCVPGVCWWGCVCVSGMCWRGCVCLMCVGGGDVCLVYVGEGLWCVLVGYVSGVC